MAWTGSPSRNESLKVSTFQGSSTIAWLDLETSSSNTWKVITQSRSSGTARKRDGISKISKITCSPVTLKSGNLSPNGGVAMLSTNEWFTVMCGIFSNIVRQTCVLTFPVGGCK